MKKLVEVDEKIWKQFERVAVERFGLYGAVGKGIGEAVKEWVEKHKKEMKENE